MNSSPPSEPARVVLYTARDCSLCERARATLAAIREDVEFDLEEVDITGDPELEAQYRELLPVVEIDGKQAFTYFVHIDSFRQRVAQARD
jgi:glutaredoxin